jgi:protease PrsW
VGLGFSFAEDLFYFFNIASDQGLDTGQSTYLFRAYILGPAVWQLGHAMYTGAFGAGLGLAVWSRSWIAKIFFPLLGLGVAMFMHAVHNGLASLLLVLGFGLEATASALTDQASGQELPAEMATTGGVAMLLGILLGYIFAAMVFLAIGLWLRYQRRVIREELAEEVDAGLISQEEREITSRYWRRLLTYWRRLWSGRIERWRALRRLYNELTDLALLKRRLKRTGSD